MKSSRVCGAVVALALAAGTVSAQTLGDLAKQEAERRKAVKASGKIYTNEKLRPEPAPAGSSAGQTTDGSAAAPAASASPAPDQAQPAAPAKPDETKTEGYWKKRIAAARESLSRSQTFADALQSRINVLSTDFVNRDDPAQRNVIAADRQKAMDELAKVKAEIAQYTKAITDIQDEARRANVPAGWVR
jgi:hypothetical protein